MAQTQHAMLAHATHDELNRQSFVSDLRMFMMSEIATGMASLYEQRVKPTHAGSAGRDPESAAVVHDLMFAEDYTRLFSSLMRSTQEMIWDSVIPGLERDIPRLIDAANIPSPKFGSLTLDATVAVPAYVSGVDIHCMPGNYHTERTAGDVAAGALYDRGLYVYQDGVAGGLCDSNGRTQAEFIRQRFPEFKPQRILDLGCTIGNNTLPYGDVFPDAELHAIDVAAPSLRYAHARAESLEVPVHFHQMDAEALAFADGSFDLVVSCILFHETSTAAFERIIREAQRVLRPGGMMLHMEGFEQAKLSPYEQFYSNWDSFYNNEPFIRAWQVTDKVGIWKKAGFADAKHIRAFMPDVYSVSSEDFADAATGETKVGPRGAAHWGESFVWEMFGAWK